MVLGFFKQTAKLTVQTTAVTAFAAGSTFLYNSCFNKKEGPSNNQLSDSSKNNPSALSYIKPFGR